MSEQEKFLARWSRRKIAAEEETVRPADEKAATQAGERATNEAGTVPAAEAVPAAAPEPGFDLNSLPSLESIGPNSDIRAFLQPGVPAALSHAALRRAWVADPAIRDFVGLAENAWDFTADNAAMGFGPLAPGEAARHLADFLNEAGRKAAPAPAADETDHAAQSAPQSPALADAGARTSQPEVDAGKTDLPDNSAESLPDDGLLQRNNAGDASQQVKPANHPAVAASRRGHGGALPQ